MTLEEQDRENLIRLKVEKSDEALNDAAFLLSDNRFHAAVNRIYYSAFYILSALALKHGFITSKHRQIIGWFNKEFVKLGKASPQAGKFIHNAYDKRSLGDYDDFTRFSAEDVSAMLRDAKTFVDEINGLVK